MASASFENAYPRVRIGRLLGVLNLLFAAVGLVALLVNVVGFLGLPSSFTEGLARFFYQMGISSLVLLCPLAYAGIQLLRRNPRASVLCSAVFCVEILFFVVFWLVWPLPLSPLSVVEVTAGFMNLGLALQAVTAYPVIGLILLNTTRHKA